MKKKNKVKERMLCFVFKHYRDWVQVEKSHPGIGEHLSTFYKLRLGPSSCLIEDYCERKQQK